MSKERTLTHSLTDSEKIGSGLVVQAPARIFSGGGFYVFFAFFCAVFMFPNISQKNKKLDGGGGGWVGSDQSGFFSEFFDFFSNLTRFLSGATFTEFLRRHTARRRAARHGAAFGGAVDLIAKKEMNIFGLTESL